MVKRRRGADSPVTGSGSAADAGAVGNGKSTATADGAGSGVAGGSQGGSSSSAALDGAAPDIANPDGSGNSDPTVGGKSKGRGAGFVGKDSTSEWLERIRKQLDFYFSDANLRRDKFLQQKLKEGGDFVPLKTFLQFNRIKALKCRNPADLARAIQKSDMLVLSPDRKKVGRDLAKAPIEDTNPLPRTVYVEGFPLRLSLDDLTSFFSRHGVVRLVDRPRHPQTREPLGHCFVEYASAAEAEAAAAGLDGYWHPTWPQMFDGKVLHSFLKQRWLDYKCEFKALKRASRGATSSAAPEPVTASTTGATSSTATGTSSGAAGEAIASPPIGATSAASTPAAPSSKRRGCLVRITGFPDPQTRLSIRQFVEHAVPVEYCDFETGLSWAHLTLRSAEDCRTLLEDLRLTRRLLGALRPQVTVLGPEEEDEYWQEVKLRRASRDSAATEPPARKSARRRQSSTSQNPSQKMKWNPQGIIDGGPTKQTVLRLWVGDEAQRRRAEERPGNSSDAAPASAPSADQAGSASSAAAPPASGPSRVASSFVDTVAGNGGMVQAGLGWRQRSGGRKFKPKARLRAPGSRAPPPMPPPVPPGISATGPIPNPSPPLMPPPPVRLPGGPPAKVPRVASSGSAASSSSAIFMEPLPAGSDSDGELDKNFLLSVPLPPPSPACPGAFPKRGTLKGAKAKKMGAPQRNVPMAPPTPGGGAGAAARGPRSALGGAGPLTLLPPPSPFAVHSERQAGKSTEVRLPPPSPVAVHSTGAPAAGAAGAASASDGASAAAGGSGTGAEPSASDAGPSKAREEDKSTPVIDSMLEDAEDILSLDF